MSSLLSGCSTVPDYLNPVEWYKGVADAFTSSPSEPEVAVATPRAPSAAAKDAAAKKSAPTEGLAADRSHAKYADSVSREVAPTKSLARKQQAEPTQVAAAEPEAEPAAPAANLSLGKRQPTARDTGPARPPSYVDMTPPARPDIPVNVPVTRGARALEEHYQRRLAEQNAVNPGQVQMPQGAGSRLKPAGTTQLASAGTDYGFGYGGETIRLTPPSTMGKSARAGKASRQAAEPAATFQVAALSFQGSGTRLTAEDQRAIADVARLYKASPGTVRVVAGSYGDADARADAVARALVKAGVPARKVLVATDDAQLASDPSGARVFLDY